MAESLVKVGSSYGVDFSNNESLGITIFKSLKERREQDETMLIHSADGSEVSAKGFVDITRQLAISLSELPIEKGDVVTIAAENSIKALASIVSLLYLGAKINLVNPDYTTGELQHLFDICKPKVVLCSSKALKNVLQVKDFSPNAIINFDNESDDAEGVTNFQNYLLSTQNYEAVLKFEPVQLNPHEEVAFIFVSSGTTGLPKAVMVTHAGLASNLSFLGDPNIVQFKKEVVLGFLPFFHLFGAFLALGSLIFEAKCVIMAKFDPKIFLTSIQNHRIARLFVVAPILQFLTQSPMVASYDVSSVKDIFCSASRVTPALLEKVKKTFNESASIYQAYGLTEGGAVTLTPRNNTKLESVGKVLTVAKIKVCDIATGKALGPNENGEIRVTGGGIMKGYYNNEEATREAFDENGYLKTGDWGYYDEDDYFYLLDRIKEVIKYKAFQVSPAELENILLKHPAIQDAAVVGVPDERAGELPLALVVKQPNVEVTQEDIILFVAENVSIQKQLHGGVKFVEALPKSVIGKTLRHKLKELL